MTAFRQALGNAQLAIGSLILALFLSFLLNLYLGYQLYRVPRHMTVFVPSNIGNNGYHTSNGKVSAEQVYQFAYGVWTSLTSWSGDGAKAFASNLSKNKPYLSVGFQNTLKSEINEMNNQGFLYNHSQVSYGVSGSAFNSKSVKYIGNSTWLVHLDIRTVNFVDSNDPNKGFGEAHKASDAETSFVFKVTRFPIIKNYNTSGLVLSGFALPPKVVKVYQ